MSAFQNYPRITPFLWFDSNAEDAVNFYLSVFKNSRILEVAHNGPANPNPPAKILTISFELDGQTFTALNGGPLFQFNESVSFLVRCDTQQEVDDYWKKLTAGGTESPMRLAEGQVRPLVADRSRAATRPHQTPKSHAGHDADEKNQPRRTRTSGAIVS